MSDGARVCDGPAARRRDRRLRQGLRHERLAIRTNVAEMRHHSRSTTDLHPRWHSDGFTSDRVFGTRFRDE